MHAHSAVSLQLDIIAGRGLASKDRNGLSDPYCKVWFEDENGSVDPNSKRKTCVKKKTLNPEWMNESFTFVLLSKHKVLVIQCWDKDRLRKNDFMGEIVIPLTDLGTNKHGWISLQQKRGAKKQEKISGELNIAVTLHEEKIRDNIEEREKISRTINKLFDRALSALDIYSVLSCNLVDKTAKFGTLTATKESLCFFTERKRRKRKAIEISWWEIGDISTTGDSITVTLGAKSKAITFEDIVENNDNTIQAVVHAWEKQSRIEKPSDHKKSHFHFGKKIGKLKKLRDSTSGDTHILNQLADITDYTEITEPSVDSPSEESEELNNNLCDGTPEVFDSAKPISIERADDEHITIRPLDKKTLATKTKDHPDDAPIVHFIAKQTGSKHNPGLTSMFIKLVECQFLPEQSYGPPNVFVETKIGSQLYISAIETGDRHPVFSEEYLLEVNTERDSTITFSVYHSPENGQSEFIAETTMKIADIPAKELLTFRKELKFNQEHSRLVEVEKSKRVPALGRIQAKIGYDKSQSALNVKIVKYQALRSPYEDYYIEGTIANGNSKQTDTLAGEIIDVNTDFQYGSISKKDILKLSICRKSGHVIGYLNFNVYELNRPLPRIWYEIPDLTTESDEESEKSEKSKDKSESRRETRSPIKFSQAVEGFEKKKKPKYSPRRKSPNMGELTITPPKRRLDKTRLIAALAVIFVLLGLLYKLFF